MKYQTQNNQQKRYTYWRQYHWQYFMYVNHKERDLVATKNQVNSVIKSKILA